MDERMKEILARKVEIRKALEGKEKVDLAAVQKELEALEAEQKEIEERKKVVEALKEDRPAPVEKRSVKKEEKTNMVDFDSAEYRKAFMDHVTSGKAIPAEFRANQATATTDIEALVPPVTLNKIIEKVKTYGMILPLVTKTNYATGMAIPTATVKPKATWVAEGKGSERQKKELDTTIVFGHFKLRCAVAVTLETAYMAYSAFEAAVVDNIAEAMAVALEEAIISGDGSGKPTGILKATGGQELKVKTLNYKTLIDAEAALPMAYESGAVWVMNKGTFMAFVGMTDKNDQPIARVNYGITGAPERFLLGRRVVLTEYLPNFSAELGATDTYAFLFRMQDYVLNTNFTIGMKVYEDNETDDIVRKSIMVCDGKPVITESLVKLVKGA